MSERSDELRDDELGARLKSALGPAPPGLLPRLERVAAAGLRPGTGRPAAPLWLELGPQLAAVVLLFAFVAAVVPRLGAPAVLAFLAPPLALLLGIELTRGAPRVRGWFR